jgi:predicted O-methyltransferase YrrM
MLRKQTQANPIFVLRILLCYTKICKPETLIFERVLIMSKKVITGIVVVLLFTSVGNLIAKKSTAKAPAAASRKPAVTEHADRPGFDLWLEGISQAHEQNDKVMMGQLIEDMKARRARLLDPTRIRRLEGGPVDRSYLRSTSDKLEPKSTAKSSATPAQTEKHILSVLEDLHDNQRQGMMNVTPQDGRLLRLLTEVIRARRVIEIGTSNGYSGIWFSLALRRTGGILITHEIDKERAALARKNFKKAKVDDIITLVEGDAHKEITKLKAPIDILFLDADKEGYVDYLNKLLPLVRKGGLILAHNTTNSGDDMKDYIKAVTTNPDLETIFLHEQDRGMGVTLKKR